MFVDTPILKLVEIKNGAARVHVWDMQIGALTISARGGKLILDPEPILGTLTRKALREMLTKKLNDRMPSLIRASKTLIGADIAVALTGWTFKAAGITGDTVLLEVQVA